VERHPDSAAGHEHLGEALVAAGRLAEAEATFRRAQTLDPQGNAAREGRVTVAILEERWADAQTLLDEMAQSTNPAVRVSGLRRSATVGTFQGQSARALDRLDQARRIQGASLEDRVDASVQQVMLLREVGQTSLALSESQQAVADGQGTFAGIGAVIELAFTQASAGRRADATQTAARAEDLVAVFPAAPFKERLRAGLQGGLALAAGDAATAILELTRAVDLLPSGATVGESGGDDPIELRFQLASAHLAMGQTDEAARWLELITGAGYARAVNPIDYVRSHVLLARIYDARGDAARARPLYSRFLDFWGDGDMYRDDVAEARRKIAGG
jgi:tetratricopeptide (TPR) repeat protein